MKIAYFDCSSGAGGDMIVAAMLDAGLDFEYLKNKLATLYIDAIKIRTEKTNRAGLAALKFIPDLPHEHHHRRLADINAIIDNSNISDPAKDTAKKIFHRLAKAEAKVHDIDIEKVHFHEVGALDSITDIVSAAIGYNALGIEKLYCSPLALGAGTIKAAHGIMPVPAPATAELIKGLPVKGGPVDKELLTPTAAAILKTLVDSFGPMPAMKINSIGCGAGSLELDQIPNVTRLLIGQSNETDACDSDSICLIETNIDDATGEQIAQTMQILLREGALDVFTSPIYMKNNRPAVKLSVICSPDQSEKMQKLILTQGITFGIRLAYMNRQKLAREFNTVQTRFGKVNIKTGYLDGKIVNTKCEFSDCVKLAQKHGLSPDDIAKAAFKAFEKNCYNKDS